MQQQGLVWCSVAFVRVRVRTKRGGRLHLRTECSQPDLPQGLMPPVGCTQCIPTKRCRHQVTRCISVLPSSAPASSVDLRVSVLSERCMPMSAWKSRVGEHQRERHTLRGPQRGWRSAQSVFDGTSTRATFHHAVRTIRSITTGLQTL